MILEPLLKYLYGCRGYALVHGGAVSRDHAAVLILGSNGAHKTRLVLELCRRHGWEFSGDDLVLIRAGRVEPFVEHCRVLYTRVSRLAAGRRIGIPRPFLVPLFWGRPPALPGGLRIGTPTAITGVLRLERCLHPGPVVTTGPTPVPPAVLGAYLRHSERLELCRHQRRHHPLTPFDRFVMAYEYARPGSRLYADLLGPEGAASATAVADVAELPTLCAAVPASLSADDLDRLCRGCDELIRKGAP